MKHIANKTALLLCLLALAISTFAASEAEFGKLSKAWTLHADGSQEFRCNKELTLFTHTAMNGTYGETFIVYNPTFQELKIHASYTKQKDGSIVKTPDNAFVEVLPRMAANAPAFNHLKEMVVVHTGLELGATIYLDYSIITRPGYYAELDIADVLTETSPVKELKLTISAPEGKPLNFQLYGSAAKPSEVKQNGMRTLSWTLKSVTALPHASFMPQNRNGIPQLAASTYASPKEALAALDKSLKASVDFESKAFAEYITEKATGDAEKLQIVRNHVANNLGSCGVGMDNTGYTVRDADIVLRSAYATPAEKARLLNAMLNAVGIRSEIVAVYPATLAAEACGLKAIKSLALKATVDGKDVYLSAASLAPSAITARGELDRLYTLSGNSLTVAAVPTEVKESKEVAVDAAKAANGYVVCTLPAVSAGVDGWHMNALNSKSTELFELPSLIDQTITYTVKPADGLKLQTPSAPLATETPFGKVTRTITPKGNTIEVVRTIRLNKLQFTPAEYAALRQLINAWVDPNNSILLFSAQ